MIRSKKMKEWEILIADHAATGLSDREWCAEHGVTNHQLRYWRSHLQKQPERVAWAAVQIVPEDIPNSKRIAIHIGAARIEVHSGFDQVLLSEVLRVVTASC